jgi:KaiC/GvpD/RAD55 family RecA-like ATPase
MESRCILMYEVTSGIINSAQKVVINGPEGIGKSTMAAQFPNPVFIDTEGNTKRMNVKRFPKPTSWEMLQNEIREVMNKHEYKTLVIDTIDWAE